MSVRFLIGDARERLKELPDESVHCIVTSPPYFGLRSYLLDGHDDKPKEIGAEATPVAYVAELVAVFREVRRVLRSDGTVWLNIGDSYATQGGRGEARMAELGKPTPGAKTVADARGGASGTKMAPGLKPKDLIGIPWRLAFALQDDGWWLRQDIVWSKPNPMPESVTDRCTKSHEYVFLLTKSASYAYDAQAIAEPAAVSVEDWKPARGQNRNDASTTLRNDGDHHGGGQLGRPGTRNKRSVWTIATAPFSEAHFATFPPELPELCIRAGTSERGCCPHCGKGWARKIEREPFERPPIKLYGGTLGHNPTGRMPQRPSTDLGWQPSCSCPPHEPVPATVLDPFAGAGTTGLVADRLGRNAILIELNPAYAAMARERIGSDAGMFACLEAAE